MDPDLTGTLAFYNLLKEAHGESKQEDVAQGWCSA
jgi:hypothetical protein